MSKVVDFFKKVLGQQGVNAAGGEVFGGALLGLGAAANTTNLGGYMNPNVIDGYSYNPTTGNWYTRNLFDDSFDFSNPISGSIKDQLDAQRYLRDLHNRVENLYPQNGDAGEIESIPWTNLLEQVGDIADRYSELWPEIYGDIKEYFWEPRVQQVDPNSNTNFYNGTRSRPVPRDPLAIDLDGDGIETVGIVQGANPVLFDHDADGVRTGTGWLQGDDAWLVLDRNGNGRIDSGRELFGVDTLISGTAGTASAVYASNGFEALRTLDANGDNLFNASDAAFTQVRLWRDLNQDGISQSNELSTLASQNITGIGLVPSTTVTNLGNGNTISGTATVTRSDGSATTAAGVGVSTTAANLDLANNPFYRAFTTPVALTSQAQALPEMQGSGWVRDLREAANGEEFRCMA